MNPSPLENPSVSNQQWSINNSVVPTATSIPINNVASWPASYDYYNYYQNIQPNAANPLVTASSTPAVTTNSTAPVSAVDYSKAWDEYYKAYYGKTYAEYAASQYPGYSYEQIAAYNASYQTSQQSYYPTAAVPVVPSTISTPTVNSSIYSASYSDQSTYGYQVATTNWNQPPPDYNTQYQGQSNTAYSQAPSNNQYDSYAHMQSNSKPTANYYDNSKQTNYNNQYYKSNTNENENENLKVKETKEPELSFTDRFPRPKFDTNPVRGRGQGRFRPRFDNSASGNQYRFNNKFENNDQEYGKWNEREDKSNNTNFRGRGNYRQPIFNGSNRMPRPPMDTRPSLNQGSDQRFNKPKPNPWAEEDEIETPEKFVQKPNDDFKFHNQNKESYDSREFCPPTVRSQPSNVITDLLKLDVMPSQLSQVITRRQLSIDNWQAKISQMEITNPEYIDVFDSLRQLLSPELQGMLQRFTYVKMGENHCELIFEDIFLTHACDKSDMGAIQRAALRCQEMMQNRVFVVPVTRQFGDDYVPGFCISTDPHDIPLLPSINCSMSTNTFEEPPPPSRPFKQAESCWDMQDFEDDEPVANIYQHKEPEVITPKVINKEQSLVDSNMSQSIFILLDESSNERDFNIATLQNTAKFNEITLEFKHEKKPQAPHISQCVITFDGKEVGRAEARDYLVAKRQAAEETLVKLKKINNVVGKRLDEARFVLKSDINAKNNISDGFRNYFKEYLKETLDKPLRFGSDFTGDEKSALTTVVKEFPLSYKSESMYIYVYREFPVLEVKNRLLTHGCCGQYRLIEKVIEQ